MGKDGGARDAHFTSGRSCVRSLFAHLERYRVADVRFTAEAVDQAELVEGGQGRRGYGS